MSLQNKKTELNVIIREKGASNIQVKIINEEIEEVKQRMDTVQNKLNEENKKFEEFAMKRESMQRQWQMDKGLKDMHLEVLELMMKEQITVVEKMEQQTLTSKSDIKVKVKELQIAKLQEQIVYRDEIIEEAKRIIKDFGIENGLEDDRIVEVNDIIYDHGSIFNPGQPNNRIGSKPYSPR